VHTPALLQKYAAEQSLSVAHPFVHAPAAHEPAQVIVAGVWQEPPVHVLAGCSTNLLGHDAATQVLPSGLDGLEQTPVLVLQVPAVWHESGTGHTTEAPGTHAPALQVSFCVQALLSLHAVVLGTLKQVPTCVATLQAMQSLGSPLPHTVSQHTPSTQWSPAVEHSRQPGCLQCVVRLQDPPEPSCGTQLPEKLQKLPGEQSASCVHPPVQTAPLHGPGQVTGPGIWHVPDVHEPAGCKVNVPVHIAVPHVVPSALLGLVQTPVPGTQLPALWHWSSALHVTELPALHVPPWHVSSVHRFASRSHDTPFALATGAGQPDAGTHAPMVWHWSVVHVTAEPTTHVPDWHVSAVQRFPSALHDVPFALGTTAEHEPVAGLHVPGLLHWSPVHTTEAPAEHTPAWHVSWVQRSPSRSHDVPSDLGVGAEHTPVPVLHAPGLWHWSAVHTTDEPAVQVPL
jgi:hypothetical protein